METKPYKVMEWLRAIRDEHFEQIKNQSWQEDHQTISDTAKRTVEKIERIRNETLPESKSIS